MARLFDDAALDELHVDAPPVTAYPFSISAWFYPNDDTLQTVVIALSETGGSSHEWSMRVAGDVAGDPLIFQTNSSSATGANSPNSVNFNAWNHCVCIAASATNRLVVLNGGAQGTDTADNTPLNIDRLAIGWRGHTAGTPRYFSGRIAEVGIWSFALDEAAVAMLGLGISPLLVDPSFLLSYIPIIGRYSPEIDLKRSNTLTVTGTAAAEHPRMVYPSRRRVGFGPVPTQAGYLLVAN